MILTMQEAMDVLRMEEEDVERAEKELLAREIAAVEEYLVCATGRDDLSGNPLALQAATILLTQWHENPAMMGKNLQALDYGLTNLIVQLRAGGAR